MPIYKTLTTSECVSAYQSGTDSRWRAQTRGRCWERRDVGRAFQGSFTIEATLGPGREEDPNGGGERVEPSARSSKNQGTEEGPAGPAQLESASGRPARRGGTPRGEE